MRVCVFACLHDSATPRGLEDLPLGCLETEIKGISSKVCISKTPHQEKTSKEKK